MLHGESYLVRCNAKKLKTQLMIAHVIHQSTGYGDGARIVKWLC